MNVQCVRERERRKEEENAPKIELYKASHSVIHEHVVWCYTMYMYICTCLADGLCILYQLGVDFPESLPQEVSLEVR